MEMMSQPDFERDRTDDFIRESIVKCQSEKNLLDQSMANSLDVRLKEKMFSFDDEYWLYISELAFNKN